MLLQLLTFSLALTNSEPSSMLLSHFDFSALFLLLGYSICWSHRTWLIRGLCCPTTTWLWVCAWQPSCSSLIGFLALVLQRQIQAYALHHLSFPHLSLQLTAFYVLSVRCELSIYLLSTFCVYFVILCKRKSDVSLQRQCSIVNNVLRQQFSNAVPQVLLKHAVPAYLVRGTDLFSVRLSNKKIITTNTKIAIWYE